MKNPKWERVDISREDLIGFQQRDDLRAWAQTLGHIGLLVASGVLTIFLIRQGHFGTAALVLWIHGAMFAFLGWAGASHELQHQTVFTKRWVNELFLRLFSFLCWNNKVYFQRSHSSHHRFTLIGGQDHEVESAETFSTWSFVWQLVFDMPLFYRNVRALLLNSCGLIKGARANALFPESDHTARSALFRWARTVLVGHATLALAFIYFGQWELLLVVSFAPFINTFFASILAMAQHWGLKTTTWDFRSNTRTVLLNPFLSFLYWNMNYHVEHHMYPAIPFYQLPNFRKHISGSLPVACNGIGGFLRVLRNGEKRQKSL